MSDKPVFLYQIRRGAERLVADVIQGLGIRRLDVDPKMEGVRWNPIYQGFCTCGFDSRFADWLEENRHARSCKYPEGLCTCGQWVELERWREGEGHSPRCKKSLPTLTIAGVGLFVQPDGKMFASVDYSVEEWNGWANRAIGKVVAAA